MHYTTKVNSGLRSISRRSLTSRSLSIILLSYQLAPYQLAVAFPARLHSILVTTFWARAASKNRKS